MAARFDNTMTKLFAKMFIQAMLPIMRWALTWPVDPERKAAMACLIAEAERALAYERPVR